MTWRTAIAPVYTRLAVTRRRYHGDPSRQRRLVRPVVSVGSLAVGGAGKTPVVAHVAACLLDDGERPAILTRGYARTDAPPGVVVVSDGMRLLADLARSGDEPLMLARSLPGAGVFVCADRYLAGALAERQFGATVHLLDDGLQHMTLARNVDLVVVSTDIERDQMLPAGRLREPLDTLSRADALLVTGSSMAEARELAARWQSPKVFLVNRSPGVPRMTDPWGAVCRVPRSARTLAFAGVARPARFFDDLDRAGWTLVERIAFPDHSAFSAGDVARLAERARASQAEILVTTEKDAVRLLPLRPLPVPIAWIPLTATITPTDDFRLWLRWRLAQARGEGSSRSRW